jgi:acyl carrier protein
MNREEIRCKLQDIFRLELDANQLSLEETMSIADIEEWDSLSHVIICKAIEGEFGISFTAREMLACEDIASIMDVIEKKQ